MIKDEQLQAHDFRLGAHRGSNWCVDAVRMSSPARERGRIDVVREDIAACGLGLCRFTDGTRVIFCPPKPVLRPQIGYPSGAMLAWVVLGAALAVPEDTDFALFWTSEYSETGEVRGEMCLLGAGVLAIADAESRENARGYS